MTESRDKMTATLLFGILLLLRILFFVEHFTFKAPNVSTKDRRVTLTQCFY